MENWAVFQFLEQGAYFISVYPLGFAYAAGLCLLPKMERRKYMEMAGCSGTNGIDELHRAIRHWYVPVLWYRLGMGEHNRTVVYGSNRAGCLPVSNAVQPLVAFRLQIRAVGMDMADADIRYGKWLEIR